jgi:hypothetical protein
MNHAHNAMTSRSSALMHAKKFAQKSTDKKNILKMLRFPAKVATNPVSDLLNLMSSNA